MNDVYGYDDDDDAQVDGDAPVAFIPKTGVEDWLREGMPPWHLWGNSETITTVVQEASSAPIVPSSAQLVKVSYKRPESWHWVFSSRLISGPAGSLVTPAGAIFLTVFFDLIVGVGRSSIQMQQVGGAGFTTVVSANSRSFEKHEFFWDGAAGGFPVGAKIWTTQALAPNRRFQTFAPISNSTGNAVAPLESASVVDQIVAQDIQLSCRVFASAFAGDTAIGQPVVLEVSAQFAPLVHVRPDWARIRRPAAERFAGAETGGK